MNIIVLVVKKCMKKTGVTPISGLMNTPVVKDVGQLHQKERNTVNGVAVMEFAHLKDATILLPQSIALNAKTSVKK